jgi:predicted transcriptional regulator YheO
MESSQRRGPAPVPGGSTEREHLIAVLTALIEPLGHALPASSEAVLHDLARLPDSIVAVSGDVTGRRVGDPATDLLLEQAASGRFQDRVGYRTRLPDGRAMRSTTMIVRDSAGTAVAALCINTDLSVWTALEKVARTMTGTAGAEQTGHPADDAGPAEAEHFVRDVDELAAQLIHEAVREQGIPVDLMKKEHKIAVVRSLQARGMFMLRDAVEMIATSLHVTRFTIYNYLNEISEDRGRDGRPR